MNSVICTLFEGHYHYGVATLSNSLYSKGFRGTIYVGYRGELPNWALKGKKVSIGKWKYAITLSPVEGLELVFLPLKTNYSLTNYKPNFMLELWEDPAKNADALFYFDPDIVVNDSWRNFEHWVNCGVALSEDINSPLQEFHPIRIGWRNYYKDYNIELQFKNPIYVNGGFIGLIKKDIIFLKLWMQLQQYMAIVIGGLENSIFSGKFNNLIKLNKLGYHLFAKTDQDALNATIEAYNGRISYFGKEGMGFESGHITMYHALGSPKPWQTNHLFRAINGIIPREVDIEYWKNTRNPVLAHNKLEIQKKGISINLAKLIGRFYKL